MKWVRVKDDAAATFLRREYRKFGGPLPKTYYEHIERLRQLGGRVLRVEREYGDRIVLAYDEEVGKEVGTNAVAIDLEADLVEEVTEK
jgi:hypothetical protein